VTDRYGIQDEKSCEISGEIGELAVVMVMFVTQALVN
jgi:hypothetical protein